MTAQQVQEFMFYDDVYDAVEKSIAISGKTKKSIAAAVYPGRQPETAKSLLSRSLSPENTDVNLNIENLMTIMRETRADDVIYFLCDEFGFERPERRAPEKLKTHIAEQVKSIDQQLKTLMRMIPTLEEKR